MGPRPEPFPTLIRPEKPLGTKMTDDRLMSRNSYRRFSEDHESIPNTYTMSANSVAVIGWSELGRTAWKVVELLDTLKLSETLP
jgi:hypothetical protein